MNPSQTTSAPDKLVADPKRSKMIKIKALKAIQVTDKKSGYELSMKEGDVAEVPEEIAKEYCDRTFQGPYGFSGERDTSDSVRHKTVRAVRL